MQWLFFTVCDYYAVICKSLDAFHKEPAMQKTCPCRDVIAIKWPYNIAEHSLHASFIWPSTQADQVIYGNQYPLMSVCKHSICIRIDFCCGAPMHIWQKNSSRVLGGDLTLIPAWISNYILDKVWDEITYSFAKFNGGNVREVWEWISNFIPHLRIDVIAYTCWD